MASACQQRNAARFPFDWHQAVMDYQVVEAIGWSPSQNGGMYRNEIADEYGEPYARLAVLLNDVRGWAKGVLPTYQDRKVFFESIVNGEPDPIELLRRGDEAAVRDLIAAAQQTHQPA